MSTLSRFRRALLLRHRLGAAAKAAVGLGALCGLVALLVATGDNADRGAPHRASAESNRDAERRPLPAGAVIGVDSGARVAEAGARVALSERDHGYEVIFAGNRAGRFAQSAALAVHSPDDIRRDLVIAAYHDWGRHQPEAAVVSATHVDSPAARALAVQAAFSGWARVDPAGLAEAALGFPDGVEKSSALTKALRAWLVADPWTAGDWILTHPPALAAAEAALRENG